MRIDWLVATFDLFTRPLVDGSLGDVALVTQLVGGSIGNINFAAATNSFSAPPFIDEGGSISVTGVFAPIAQDQALLAHWRRSAFFAQATAMHPQATGCDDSLRIAVEPEYERFGLYGDTASLVEAKTSVKGTDDVVIQRVPYGNPYPKTWGKFLSITLTCQVTLPIGSNNTSTVTSVIQTFTEPTVSTLTPTLTPVRNLIINNKDAFTNLTGVGLQQDWKGSSAQRGVYTVSPSRCEEPHSA
jgi:hypothetical protein